MTGAKPGSALILALVLAGCAAEVVRQPAQLSPAPASGIRFINEKPASVNLDTGYSRTIAAGTEFIELGRIAQGRILKPTRATITVEGAHVHEAYPVVEGGRIVGFYLPVERAFSGLATTVDFPLKETR